MKKQRFLTPIIGLSCLAACIFFYLCFVPTMLAYRTESCPEGAAHYDLCSSDRQTKAAEEAAFWTKVTSLTAIAGTAFGLLSVLFAGSAAYFTYKQFLQESDNFKIKNPPRLKVKNIHIEKFSPLIPMRIGADIYNEGMETARINGPRCRSKIFALSRRADKPLPSCHIERKITGNSLGHNLKELSNGQYYQWDFVHNPLSKREYKEILNKKRNFYVIGLIKYENERLFRTNAHYRVLFCYKYNPKKRYFEVFNAPGYNL